MSTILPKIRTNRGNIGNEVFVALPNLSAFEKTYLSADEAAAQTVLSVLQGTNYNANEYVIIGIPGMEQTEILKVSSSAAGTITLSSGLAFDHPQGTPITFIPFNQIEFYSASSSGGSFSLLTTVGIRIDAYETYFPRTADAITVYYKARFKNENDTTYSDYSDEVSAAGYAYNSVFSIKDRALRQSGEELGGILTDQFLDESLWEGRREFDGKRKRWSFRTSFNYDAANLTEGQYSIAVPSTLRNKNSPQNILGMRIGNRGRKITYIDKTVFDRWYQGIFHTTVATQPSVGQTTLVLANVRDLAESGSVVVGSNTITYTAKTNSTATLSGIPATGTGSITAAHAVGVDAWQNASFGEPTEYTIFEETIYFNVPIGSDFEGVNVFMDFYRALVEKDSDADILDEPDVDMFVHLLKYRIKDKKKKGEIKIENDSDYKEYLSRMSLAINNEKIDQGIGFSPDIGHLIDVD